VGKKEKIKLHDRRQLPVEELQEQPSLQLVATANHRVHNRILPGALFFLTDDGIACRQSPVFTYNYPFPLNVRVMLFLREFYSLNSFTLLGFMNGLKLD